MTPTPPKEPALPPRGAFVPRAIVNRDTRGVVKLVVEAATGRVRGEHAVAAPGRPVLQPG
jgi:pyruvate/2-oxoglutarate dehydrogenase complex dihydrolipoamide dehydrogenase (E3) component